MALSKIETQALDVGQIGGRRNLIINGAAVHDQRNGGSSFTPTASGQYTLDRWRPNMSASSKFSVQQSTESPASFTNSVLITYLAATTVSASDQYFIGTRLEGYNIAHLNFGSSDAQTITLSFWVRSSLTGTFGAGIFNSAANRCFPISYTISSADTWEQKTVTIAGDTSGTWVTDNGVGLQLIFSLGIGSTFQGTAGAWTSSAHLTASSTVNLVETNGATFYFTGVQLEVGSVATPFEHRSYGEELTLCQRYYYRWTQGAQYGAIAVGMVEQSNELRWVIDFPTIMRANPDQAISSTSHWTAWDASFSTNINTRLAYYASKQNAFIRYSGNSSGFTIGRALTLYTTEPAGTAWMEFNAEL